MGDGPLYPFWVPYHLPHFEAPNAIARVVLLGDHVAPPLGGPVVEVCAVAKRDLKAGEVLDDYGMFMTYGEAVNAEEMCERRYLPEGLVEGCTLLRDVAQDEVLTYDDVELPAGRVADQLARRAVPPLPGRELARGATARRQLAATRDPVGSDGRAPGRGRHPLRASAEATGAKGALVRTAALGERNPRAWHDLRHGLGHLADAVFSVLAPTLNASSCTSARMVPGQGLRELSARHGERRGCPLNSRCRWV